MTKGQELSIGLSVTSSTDSITIRSDKEIYNVWKKLPDAKEWGSPIVQRLIGLEYVDRAVTPGTAYEYKIKDFNGATGYVLAGYQVPPVTNRGKLILVVESTYAGALTSELARFEKDLTNEGWVVIRRACSRNDSPESVKATIKDAYLLDPDHTNAVILFGAVPVFHSGFYSYDGHEPTAVAADTFYGSFGDWSGKPNIIP